MILQPTQLEWVIYLYIKYVCYSFNTVVIAHLRP